jgi:hypothetical protein
MSQARLTFGADILTTGSFLLTPALRKMQVRPEMLLITKDREKTDSRPEVLGEGFWNRGLGARVKMEDSKFKIQDATANTPYDGISPEVFEKNGSARQECAHKPTRHRGVPISRIPQRPYPDTRIPVSHIPSPESRTPEFPSSRVPLLR